MLRIITAESFVFGAVWLMCALPHLYNSAQNARSAICMRPSQRVKNVDPSLQIGTESWRPLPASSSTSKGLAHFRIFVRSGCFALSRRSTAPLKRYRAASFILCMLRRSLMRHRLTACRHFSTTVPRRPRFLKIRLTCWSFPASARFRPGLRRQRISSATAASPACSALNAARSFPCR